MQTQNNYTGFKSELKQIGDRIEAIANELKSTGKNDKVDSLYRLGDEVEHFFDDIGDEDLDLSGDNEVDDEDQGEDDQQFNAGSKNISRGSSRGDSSLKLDSTSRGSAIDAEKKASRPVQNSDENTSYGNMSGGNKSMNVKDKNISSDRPVEGDMQNFDSSGLNSVKNKF